jgi:hypothetical protein
MQRTTFALALLLLILPRAADAQSSATVFITGAGFEPKTVTIPVGGRVTFVNNDTTFRDVQPDPHPLHNAGCQQIKAVGFLVPGDSRETDPFPTAQQCGYHDHVSDGALTGMIRIVSGASGTNPTGTGGANPSILAAGATTLLIVTVTPGSSPTSTGLSVNANLAPIGGAAGQIFFDDGTNGDVFANDNVFSFRATVGSGVSAGAKSLGFDVNDAQGRRGSGSISLTVQAGTGPTDTDSDGLPDSWETFFGLNPNSGAGADGAGGDPDGDGRPNLQEYQDGTHPRGAASLTRYFAEGATSSFFDTTIALANPAGAGTAAVLARFLKSDGTVVTHTVSVPALARRTIIVKQVSGLAVAEFSTVIETDREVVADRTMKWDATGYGSHSEQAIEAPSATWYLAEGATHSGFDLFYLLQNPNGTAATVTITYLRPAPLASITRTYAVAANSRRTIDVNGADAGLASTDVSAVIQANVPIVVERAMYLNTQGRTFGAGHNSAGVTALSTSWFFAEGATGPYFDLFLLLANPNPSGTTATVTYLLPNGTTVSRDYGVAANSRRTIDVENESPLLANTGVSMTVTAPIGIMAERAMWWPGGAATWQEAHNSPGATATATQWAAADGEVASGIDTYVLLANTGAAAGLVRVSLLFEDGGASVSRDFLVAANSRFNVNVAAEFPPAAGRRFGILVLSLSGVPLVVERAAYSNAGGVVWAAGANSLATRID